MNRWARLSVRAEEGDAGFGRSLYTGDAERTRAKGLDQSWTHSGKCYAPGLSPVNSTQMERLPLTVYTSPRT
uniref:Uncharacterized protein n=1 Tax=Knipowitschia caucasica TaxID=637954 RepID=A0AAV2IZ19_KNICA